MENGNTMQFQIPQWMYIVGQLIRRFWSFLPRNIWVKNSSGWNSAFKISCISNLEDFGKENGMLAWITKTYTANHGKISKVYFCMMPAYGLAVFFKRQFYEIPNIRGNVCFYKWQVISHSLHILWKTTRETRYCRMVF